MSLVDLVIGSGSFTFTVAINAALTITDTRIRANTRVLLVPRAVPGAIVFDASPKLSAIASGVSFELETNDNRTSAGNGFVYDYYLLKPYNLRNGI
jgi:hypothetical protein